MAEQQTYDISVGAVAFIGIIVGLVFYLKNKRALGYMPIQG
jgi:hypothetical protein